MKSEVRRAVPEVEHVGTAAVLAALAADEPPLLVDTRSREEFQVSHLPGAVHVPHDAGPDLWRARVPAGRSVIVYCSVGYRSAYAARALAAARPGIVHNYLGSIFEWANGGHPLVGSGGAPANLVHPFDRDWGELLLSSRRAPLNPSSTEASPQPAEATRKHD